MKKSVACAIFFLIILGMSFFVSGAEEDEEQAITCLTNKINNTDISLEEAVFSALAGIENNKINQTINSQKKDNEFCWPASGCNLKSTAQVLLAKRHMKQNTTEIEKWLLSKTGVSTQLSWFLQVTITNNLPATCEIRIDNEVGGTFSIDEEMKIVEGSVGSCLTRTESGYWLRIGNNCLEKTFDISCRGEFEDFKTNLLYRKETGGPVYVSVNTHSANSDSWTQEKVSAACFKTGSNCDYEGSLWATLALYNAQTDNDKDDVLDYDLFIPYVKSLAEENIQFFPSAFLMDIIGSGANNQYYDNIIQAWTSDPRGGFWTELPKAASRRVSYYNTALALLGMGRESTGAVEYQETINYLIHAQEENGCWNNGNVRDTAFLIYALGWQGGIGSTTSECGNGIVEEGEQCEPSIDVSATCEELELGSGSVGCYPEGHANECRYNTTLCAEGSDTPPPIYQNACEDIGGVCRESCEESEVQYSGECSEGGICCGTDTDEDDEFLTACEDASYFCAPDNFACLENGGELLPSDLFPCQSWSEVCCTVPVNELPTCAAQGGVICAFGETCTSSVVQALDGSCCLALDGCVASSGTDEDECSFDSDCALNEICSEGVCVTNQSGGTADEEGSSLWIWILVLAILIIIVVIGIIYRNKLRLAFSNMKNKKGKNQTTKPGWPPSGGAQPVVRRMPPRFGGPAPNISTSPRPPMRAQIPPRPIVRQPQKPMSDKEREMEETLKKLKEMSK